MLFNLVSNALCMTSVSEWVLFVYMLQTLHEQMAASVHEISNLIDPVAVAARSEASQLGHKVKHRTTSLHS